MLVVLIFIFGLFIGSMVEWFSYKIPKEENGPMKSNIEKCFKYARRVFNKRTIISILIGSVYCMLYFKYKFSIDFFRYTSVCTILFVVALIDYKTKDVYFSTTCIAAVLSIAFIIIGYFNGVNIKSYVFAGIAAGIFSTILAALNVIGWGDVEIFIVCGLLVGVYKVAVVVFISIVLCGVYGIYILIRKNNKKGLRVAFGPYIVVALMLVIIFVK
ncbi:prepilin peptidase [Clostridium guangxiense]|uniref:prepilin peptidase n=1 Tax=Clostridium guangxiense TaxID=1662055 RepID=UPI001E31B979|nr:A24 family peptidase [Clostridium guangxiense]MCD2345098.1 A24 family peptidase [Clostridium guangxiense]